MVQIVRRSLRPEFVNRIDEIIVFRSLTKEQIGKIARLLLDRTTRRLKAQGIEFTEEAVGLIAERGFDPEFGARPLRRTILTASTVARIHRSARKIGIGTGSGFRKPPNGVEGAFGPSTVRGGLGRLPETFAEIFCPFPRPLPRCLYLRLFDALFAVGPVPEIPESFAGLRVQDGLHRFFDGLTAPVRSSLSLARQDLVRHLRDRLLRLQGVLLPLGIL